MLSGGLCRYCVLFAAPPTRGGTTGAKPGVLVLAPYQKPYTKALGNDVGHQQSAMHRHDELFYFISSEPLTNVLNHIQ